MNATRFIFPAVPATGFILLFFTLAVHMYISLGGWPASIGDHGFPVSLKIHSDVTRWYFYMSLLVAVFITPLCLLVSILFERTRPAAKPLLIMELSYFGAALMVGLAPQSFLYWWWD